MCPPLALAPLSTTTPLGPIRLLWRIAVLSSREQFLPPLNLAFSLRGVTPSPAAEHLGYRVLFYDSSRTCGDGNDSPSNEENGR